MRYLLLMTLVTLLVGGGCGADDSDDKGGDILPAPETSQTPLVAEDPNVEEYVGAPAKTPDKLKEKVERKDTTAQNPGYLNVQTKPWSRVSVDGKFIKNTPLVNYRLKPGTHDVMVNNPQFKIKRSFKVKIISGKTTTLAKKLI